MRESEELGAGRGVEKRGVVEKVSRDPSRGKDRSVSFSPISAIDQDLAKFRA